MKVSSLRSAAVWIVACALGCEASDPAGSDGVVVDADAGARDAGGQGESDAADGRDAAADAAAAGMSGQGGGGSGGGGEGGGGSGATDASGDGDGDGDGDADGSVSDGGALTDGAQGDQGAACLGAGSQVAPSGAGECASPFVVDMRALEYGDGVVHEAGAASTNGLVPSLDKCAAGTARDIVYTVQLPSDADLEVSVDRAEGADPSILVQEGPDAACDKAAVTECVDESGAGGCEYLRVRATQGSYESSTPQVVIGEVEHSGVPLTVRFRLIDPGGGS
jgi:hypothetical protein